MRRLRTADDGVVVVEYAPAAEPCGTVRGYVSHRTYCHLEVRRMAAAGAQVRVVSALVDGIEYLAVVRDDGPLLLG